MHEKILKICEELCCTELVSDEPLISTKLLDSFRLMELICILEEEFQITCTPEEITEFDHFSSVDHIVDFVAGKQVQ